MTYIAFVFLIIFLPGITWEALDKNFASKIQPDKFEFILRSAVFGILSYICVSTVNHYLGWVLPIDDFEKVLKSSDVGVSAFLTIKNIKFISEAEIISIIFAILWILVKNSEIYIRCLKWFDKQRKYGPYDVWDRILNECLTSRTAPYVVIRDFDNQITYEGAVQYFTENDGAREIVLTGALIRDDEKGLLEIDRLYLSLDPKKIIMDIVRVDKVSAQEGTGG